MKPYIKVNDNYRIESDRYNFILIEIYEGQDKDGNPKTQEREQYFPTIEQCLRRVRQNEIKACFDIDEVLAVLKKSYELDRISAEAK